MMDEIITRKISLWAQRGLNDSYFAGKARDIKMLDKNSNLKQRVSKNISQNSISKQLSLF
jgi:hypothetical protein